MEIVALVVGATGIAGRGVSQELLHTGASVHGISRHREGIVPGVKHVAADLFAPASVGDAVSSLKPSHVYLTVWSRRPTEEENISVNAGIVRTVLDAIAPARTVKHVALVTGLKHYLGPFEAYARSGLLPPTPVREEQPRLDVPNFYYAQEDELFAAARRDGFTWSVHRPHTIIGLAPGNAMSMGSTLAVYATICRELGRPFVFPGSAVQWNGLTDMTDARLLARHLEWASTEERARNQDFNVVNGDIFRWSWMWGRIADWFGLRPEPFTGTGLPLEEQLADAAPLWAEISSRYRLFESDVTRLFSPWHTD